MSKEETSVPKEVREKIEAECNGIFPGGPLQEHKVKDYLRGATLMAQHQQDKWISVEDRLPEQNGRYLAMCDNDLYGIIVCKYDTGYGNQYHWNTPSGKITHWQPLPKYPNI